MKDRQSIFHSLELCGPAYAVSVAKPSLQASVDEIVILHRNREAAPEDIIPLHMSAEKDRQKT
jgi:hypothetical protein